MKEQEQWNESLRKSPFVKPRFTEKLRQEIIHKAKEKPKAKARLFRFGAAFAIVMFCVGALFAADLANIFPKETEYLKPNGYNRSEEVRTEYRRNGKALFQVFPDPDLIAGVRRGYMIHFTQSFDTFFGKTLAIEAYHQESGKQVTVLAPETITEPSPGYESLDRFIIMFSLPLGGTWRFEVKLNERFYGDFVLEIREPSPWTETGTFDIPYGGPDGNANKYVLVGEKDKVGFIIGPYQNENGELLDKAPIVAGKRNKYMWHFWGSKDEFSGRFNIMAVKEGSTREIDMISGTLSGPLNGADALTPSSMEFPEAGIWRLNAYIDNKLFSSIYVNVQP
ncbi:DUF4871 domain-containing protein [Cohnella boryungensis]|uniref:DUF4871 domain-containing protein n=1 Tax=Cohnella boryungensis TaxID=768479 RepID=A0ABV8SHB7_9BACL